MCKQNYVNTLYLKTLSKYILAPFNSSKLGMFANMTLCDDQLFSFEVVFNNCNIIERGHDGIFKLFHTFFQ